METANVKVGAFDRFGARPGIRDLDGLVLESHAIEAVDGLLSVLLFHKVDKRVAQTLTFSKFGRQWKQVAKENFN